MNMFFLTAALGLNPSKPINNFKYVGNIPPLGYFDPLKIANEKNVHFLREAELHHGRLAMLGSTFIPLYELVNEDKTGISYLSSMNFDSQLPFWYLFALVEFYRMINGWNNPFISENNSFSLKHDYQPGNLLNWNVDLVTDRTLNCELSNGRLAMIGAAYIFYSELFNGVPVIS